MKSHTKTTNLKHLGGSEMKKLNYLMNRTLRQIFKTILSIPSKSMKKPLVILQ